MNAAKIQLSQEELELVENAEWILTKNAIIDKVYSIFGVLAVEMGMRLPAALPAAVSATTAKISRGENYQGLPYVVLDYPRLFGKEHVFAVRTLFWWAHYFSITLHLKGEYKDIFLQPLRKNIGLLASHHFFIGAGNNEWEHELEGNYISLASTDPVMIENIFSQTLFLKLAAKVELRQWNESEESLLKLFDTLMQSLEAY